MDLRAVALERRNVRGADLGGLPHDGVHRRALGQRLTERDFEREGPRLLAETHLQDRAILAVAGELADPLGAPAVERDDGVTEARPIYDDEMMRLLRAERELGRLGDRRGAESAEVGHGRG